MRIKAYPFFIGSIIMMIFFFFLFFNLKIKEYSYKYGSDWYFQLLKSYDGEIFSLTLILFSSFVLFFIGAYISKSKFLMFSNIGLIVILVSISCYELTHINYDLSRMGEVDFPGLGKRLNRIDSILSKKTINAVDNDLSNYKYAKTNYVIVYLLVQQNDGKYYDEYGLLHYDGLQKLNIVTDVQEIKNFDETTEAKLKDAIISNYLNSTNARLYQGKILSIKVFRFDSYIEASEKRNSYLVEK